MKVIEVVAAVIYKDGAYFATQRGYDEFEGMWEFPGGKIESGAFCIEKFPHHGETSTGSFSNIS